MTPISEPKSGEILSGIEIADNSKITITVSESASCVVKLKNANGVERLSFYVRAGDTVTVCVPDEYLYVYFASGKTWYGKDHLFGNDTSYSKDKEIRDFTRYIWTYTRTPITVSEIPISADEFK